MPSIQKIRFVSTGTEATMSAVRLARGFTGRDLIVKFDGHYHGHADFFLIQAGSGALDLEGTPASQGIPKELVKNTICLPFNDLEALERLFANVEIRERLAAVILEPIAGNMGVVPADRAWMHVLRDLTAKNGTLLIFDEVMTGFRVAKGGAQSLYGVVPDLTCLGKIVGGGLPAAAFGGRSEIMDRLAPLGPVYQAGTLSGNPLAMAAGIKALELLDAPGFYEELEKKTKRLVDPIQKLIAQESLPYCIQSVGSMLTLFVGAAQVTNAQEARNLDADGFCHLFQKLLNLGIYIPPLQQEAWFVSMAHTGEQLDRTAECVIEILSSVCYARS
jgi:glutamate-1-semialdehyde 2,1-aminomutase